MTAVASVKSTLVRRNSSVVVMHLSRWLVWALLGAAGVIQAAEPSFEYDKTVPPDIQQAAQRDDDAFALRDISYALGDGLNAATIVESKSPTTEPRAAILFVHWYGPPAPTSNRTQFIPDAVELAKNGAIPLLIDTPWSRPEYFRERTREGDYERSVLAPLGPVRYLPKLKIPKLLQFADDDEHVSKERADALAAAAQEPKTVRVYHAGHELNDEATRERIEWLKQQLKLPQP